MTPIQLIRKAASAEEIDYGLIMSCLKHYKAPRDVISRLLLSGNLIRVKKGIYVFGDHYSKRPYSLEILANMIYGPSYVSCEYALSFYGLIPESAREITSMTTGRKKSFDTPVGIFSYCHLSLERYQIGVTRLKITNELFAEFASPEKALADLIYIRKETTDDINELKRILYDDYRIDPSEIQKLRIEVVKKIAYAYQNKTISLLPMIIKGKNNE